MFLFYQFMRRQALRLLEIFIDVRASVQPSQSQDVSQERPDRAAVVEILLKISGAARELTSAVQASTYSSIRVNPHYAATLVDRSTEQTRQLEQMLRQLNASATD